MLEKFRLKRIRKKIQNSKKYLESLQKKVRNSGDELNRLKRNKAKDSFLAVAEQRVIDNLRKEIVSLKLQINIEERRIEKLNTKKQILEEYLKE